MSFLTPISVLGVSKLIETLPLGLSASSMSSAETFPMQLSTYFFAPGQTLNVTTAPPIPVNAPRASNSTFLIEDEILGSAYQFASKDMNGLKSAALSIITVMFLGLRPF